MNTTMTVEHLFLAALDYAAPEERRSFLVSSCDDDKVRSQVERLLMLHDSSPDFLQQPAVERSAAAPTVTDGPAIGQLIGPYRLVEALGEGGMGLVYAAEQEYPVKRMVALKVIKPGMDTRQVVARFDAERQALALMEHPNIARVLDAGATEAGRPYFVMELIRGVSIIEYCHEHRLGLRPRLSLFADVCDAVHHAHLKGVIHRDLKPSNVLIAMERDRPTPKVIDFGVAKAVHPTLSSETLQTQALHWVGTPLYMSPEQVGLSGTDVDTRSDVYSLGVLLYELLTGEPPFDRERFQRADFDEKRRMIREEDPQRPSVRATGSGSHGAVGSAKLVRQLRGELDWICLRASEKDRERRYQSARELGEDVQRHLRGESVTACPPAWGYRWRKFIRRYRGLVAATSAVLLCLIAGVGIATWFAIDTHRAQLETAAAKDQADTKAAIATAISEFLSQDLLRQASPFESPDRDVLLREVVEKAAVRVEGKFADQPLVEADVRRTLGTTFRQLGEYESAATHLRRSLELNRRELGEADPSTLKSAFELGLLELSHSGPESAEAHWKPTLEQQRRILGAEHRDTLLTMVWLAWCKTQQREFVQAEPLFQQAGAGLIKTLGPEHPDTLDCLDGQARLLTELERFDEAEALSTRVLETRERVLGSDHPRTDDSLTTLAIVQFRMGRCEESIQLLERSVASRRRIQGWTHPATLQDEQMLAVAYQRLGRLEAAEELFTDTIKRRRERFGPDDDKLLETQRQLAAFYHSQGRYDEAETTWRQILDARQRINGHDHELTLSAYEPLVDLYRAQRRDEDAIAVYPTIIDIQSRLFGELDQRVIDSKLKLIYLLHERHQLDAASELALELHRQVTSSLGANSHKALQVSMLQGFVAKRRREWSECERVFADAWERSVHVLGPDDRETLRARNQLAHAIFRQGRASEAEPICREALAARVRTLGTSDIDTAYSHDLLGEICSATNRPEEAVTVLTQSLRTYHNVVGPDSADANRTVKWIVELIEDLERRKAWSLAGAAWNELASTQSDLNAQASELSRSHARAAAAFETAENWGAAADAHVREIEVLGRSPSVDWLMRTHHALAALIRSGRLQEAESRSRDCIAGWEKLLPKDVRKYMATGFLGESLTAQGRYDEAEPILVLCQQVAEASRKKYPRMHKRALERMVELYTAMGRSEDANRWHLKVTSLNIRQP